MLLCDYGYLSIPISSLPAQPIHLSIKDVIKTSEVSHCSVTGKTYLSHTHSLLSPLLSHTHIASRLGKQNTILA